MNVSVSSAYVFCESSESEIEIRNECKKMNKNRTYIPNCSLWLININEIACACKCVSEYPIWWRLRWASPADEKWIKRNIAKMRERDDPMKMVFAINNWRIIIKQLCRMKTIYTRHSFQVNGKSDVYDIWMQRKSFWMIRYCEHFHHSFANSCRKSEILTVQKRESRWLNLHTFACEYSGAL